MTTKALGDVLLYLGAVSGALMAIGALLRYVLFKPLIRWLDERFGHAERSLEKVEAEVTTDDGRSMKDKIDRTASMVERLIERYEDHLIAGHAFSPATVVMPAGGPGTSSPPRPPNELHRQASAGRQPRRNAAHVAASAA